MFLPVSRFVLASVVALAGLAPMSLHAEPCLRPNDQMWMVSTRHLSVCRSAAPDQYQVSQYVPGQGWEERTADGFLAAPSVEQTGEGAATVIFIHGNRVDRGEALAMGWRVYQSLVRELDAHRRITFLIWSWPSGQIPGQFLDIRAKAARTDFEGYLLAQWVVRLPSAQPVGLIGYSFGARIVTGGLHLVGGGQLSGRTLDTQSEELPEIHAVLAAAALHNGWLVPNGRHGRLWQHTERVLNLYNHADPLLKRYRIVERHGRPQALGFTGISRRSLGEAAAEFEQRDVAAIVGRSHQWFRYFCSHRLVQIMRSALLPNMTE